VKGGDDAVTFAALPGQVRGRRGGRRGLSVRAAGDSTVTASTRPAEVKPDRRSSPIIADAAGLVAARRYANGGWLGG
jgi:hypothetical protein